MEVKLENFKGIKRSSIRRELEIPDPSYLREAKNVIIANDGSIHCHTGNKDRSPASLGTVHRIFYSRALGKYVTVNAQNGDLKVHSVSSAGVWATDFTHSTALPEGSDTGIGYGCQLVDWPLTSVAYMISPGGGGNNIYKLSVAGSTFAAVAVSISSPEVICVHKDTLWLVDGSTLYPSDNLDPETFDTGNALTISKGSKYITRLSSMGGILYAHKPDGIAAIIGDNFTGTASDVSIIDVDTGVGALRPSAGKVYKGLEWFIGPGGFYVFNGEKVKLLNDRLCMQFMRKSVV